MEPIGKIYNLYHETDNFLKEIEKYGFKVKDMGGEINISFPKIAGPIGGIFVHHILALYDDYWKSYEDKYDKKMRKGVFNILEALVERFEVK